MSVFIMALLVRVLLQVTTTTLISRRTKTYGHSKRKTTCKSQVSKRCLDHLPLSEPAMLRSLLLEVDRSSWL
jgi:hypothetical protein